MFSVLEDDAVKGKTCKAIEYKLSQTMIQTHRYGTYAVPPIWRALVSMVHMLYSKRQKWRHIFLNSSYYFHLDAT